MRSKRLSALLAGAMLASAIAAQERPGFRYEKIDRPNANGKFDVTIPQGINARGDVVGWYTDNATKKVYGFLRQKGNFTTIEYPGAVATQARGINSRGDVVGTHQGPNLNKPGFGGDIHGFLLNRGSSSPKPVDYPGHMNTIAQRITDTGLILGCYHDHDTMTSMHGMEMRDESFVALDGTEDGLNVPASMNNGGSPRGTLIAGFYTEMMTNVTRGYVIRGDSFKAFDAPGAATLAWDANASGEIVGWYAEKSGAVHGFLISEDEFVQLDYPEPGVQATKAFGISPRGDVVGTYVDAAGVTHGFVLHRAENEDD